MVPKYSILPIAVIFFVAPLLHAAPAVNLDQEYQQVRKIALRDPKVRAAYEDADRKLEAKIVQIDPALQHYQPHHATEPESSSSAAKPVSHTKPAAATGGFHATHTVVQGETLGGIASHYGISATALKNANHISDEKKLAIGQVLTIPPKSGKKAE